MAAKLRASFCLLAILYTCCRIRAPLVLISQCTCPNEKTVLQCAVDRSGSTVYNVTGCRSDQLILLHTDDDSHRECRNGDVVAYSIPELSNTSSYTSGLNITLPPDQTVTVECYHDRHEADLIPVGTKTLQLAPHPPTDVRALSINPLIFSWTAVPNDCATTSVEYLINATNCGSCQSRVSTTSVTCSEPPLSGSCFFSVQAIVCGSIIGSSSELLTISITSQSTTEPAASTTPPSSDGPLVISGGAVIGIIAINVTLLLSMCGIGTGICVLILKSHTLQGTVQSLKKSLKDKDDKVTQLEDALKQQQWIAETNHDPQVIHRLHDKLEKTSNTVQHLQDSQEALYNKICRQLPSMVEKCVREHSMRMNDYQKHQVPLKYEKPMMSVADISQLPSNNDNVSSIPSSTVVSQETKNVDAPRPDIS